MIGQISHSFRNKKKRLRNDRTIFCDLLELFTLLGNCMIHIQSVTAVKGKHIDGFRVGKRFVKLPCVGEKSTKNAPNSTLTVKGKWKWTILP